MQKPYMQMDIYTHTHTHTWDIRKPNAREKEMRYDHYSCSMFECKMLNEQTDEVKQQTQNTMKRKKKG